MLYLGNRRAKRTKIRASGVSISCIQGTFDCQVFKFSLGSFGAFPFFDDLVSRKRLLVERNGPNFGPLGGGEVFSDYTVLLTVKCSSSVRGHSVHFRFFELISRKLVVAEQMDQHFSLRGKSLVAAEYLSPLGVQGQFGVIRCISSF